MATLPTDSAPAVPPSLAAALEEQGRRAVGQPAAQAPSVGAVATYLLARLLVALMVGLPGAAAVAPIVSGYPAGDAALWRDGAVLLFEASRLLEPALPALGWSTAVVGLAGAFALLVPLAALLVSMQRPAAPAPGWWSAARRLVSRAARHIGTLALLMGSVLLLQALALGLWTTLGRVTLDALLSDEVAHDLSMLALYALGAVLVWLLGVLHDLARIAVVHRDLALLDAMAFALRLLGSGARAVLLAAGWRALGSAAALVAGAVALLELTGRGPSSVAPLATVELASLAVAVLLRVSWLHWAAARASRQPPFLLA